MGYLSRLLAFLRRLVSGEPPAPPPVPLSATVEQLLFPPTPPAVRTGGAMLRREEMLDRSGRLAGYRFSLATAEGTTSAPHGAYFDALRSARVRSLAERRLAVIVVRLDEWSVADLALLQGPHTVFQVDRPGPTADVDAWLVGLQYLRQAGADLALTFAVDEVSQPPDLTEAEAEALALVTHGFVDFSSAPDARFEALVHRLRREHPTLRLAADNVTSWPERRLCLSLGIDLAMGGFLSTVDVQDHGEKINGSRLVLMDMLTLVRRDGEARALAEMAKRDPGVAVRLLSMANAPAYGLVTPVTGLEQAVLVLGREALYRWLVISIFRAGKDRARDEALLEVALTRARFLELAALSVGSRPQADELFLVGLLSFVDALLGLPMEEVVSAMSLPPVVCDVLLRSEGPYARFLILALAVEKCLAERAAQLADPLGITLDALNHHRDEALLWAEEAVRQR